MTQGSIGYWLQNALINEFATRQAHPSVISLVTQVLVDPADPSFEKPSKPVGPFYSEEEANAAMAANGGVYQEDAGRGYRKVVPSPKPQEIVEKEAIKTLVDAGVITICAGGGGVPVVRNDNGFTGVEAVNDKDFTASVLAKDVQADRLIILTSVDNIYINYNQPIQQALGEISVAQAKGYIEEGHFAAGSMLPKIEAAIDFVEEDAARTAIITSIEKLAELDQHTGTILRK